MAQERTAYPTRLAGHGTSKDGRHGILVFTQPNGEQLILTIPSEQALSLAAAGVAIGAAAQQTLGAGAPPVPIFRVDRWKMTSKAGSRIFTFVTSGFELHFEVTPETVREEEGAR
jgi:hypothetical protein